MPDPRFSENYPIEFNQKIFDVTRGKYDFLFLEYLVNNAFLQGVDNPLVNALDFVKHYGISKATLRSVIQFLRLNKIISPEKDQPTQSILAEMPWYVPMVSDALAGGRGSQKCA